MMWKEEIVAYFMAILCDLFGQNKKTHENFSRVIFPRFESKTLPAACEVLGLTSRLPLPVTVSWSFILWPDNI
jgi:hypothetical protein